MFEMFKAFYQTVKFPGNAKKKSEELQKYNRRLVIVNDEDEGNSYMRGFLVYSPDNPEVYFLRFFNTDGSICEKKMNVCNIENMLVEEDSNRSRRNFLLTEKNEDIVNLIKKNERWL